MSRKKSYGKDAELDLKLLITLTRCYHAFSRKEQVTIKKAGLTLSQFGVLELLYHKGAMRICDIIEKTLSTGGNMTVVIDNLEKEDLVKRSADPDDRRSIMIDITEDGEKLIGSIFPGHVNNIQNILSVLTKEEKIRFIELSKKLGTSCL